MNRIIDFLRNASVSQIVDICGVTAGNVSSWRHGRYLPSARAVLAVAKHINADSAEIFEAAAYLENDQHSWLKD